MRITLQLCSIFALLYFANGAVAKDGDVQIDTTVCPISDRTPDKHSILNDSDEPYLDHNRAIKDLGTDFVVNEFFQSKEALFNFLKAVYGSIDSDLAIYRRDNNLDDKAVTFIFKGGNVMRMNANEFFDSISRRPREYLMSVYGPSFTRSDADFSVLVDEDKLSSLNYDFVMDDLIQVVYRTLSNLRDDFTNNPEKYFDFMQLRTTVAARELAKYFTKMSTLDVLKKADNPNWFGAVPIQIQLLDDRAKREPSCRYEGQNDYQYEFDPNNKANIIATPLTKGSHWIMNTINRSLEWTSDRGDLIKFYLARAKVQFEYTYLKDGMVIRKPIGGELIDVSFPHRNDFRLKRFFENYDVNIADYTLTNESTGEVLKLKAESPAGIGADLYEVVFEQFDRPWEAAKFEKRLKRLFFYSIIDMAGSYGFGSSRTTDYVAQILNNVVIPLENVYENDGKVSLEEAKTIEENTRPIIDNFQQMPKTNRLLSGLAELTHKLADSPKSSDEEKLPELIKLIKENLDVFNNLAKMAPEIVDTSKLTDAKLKSLF